MAQTKTDEKDGLLAQLKDHESKKPAAYSSLWQEQLQQQMDAILNREDFSYRPEGDALYRNYAALYTRQGEQAMRDAYGVASAMTGGYGSSYAQSAAQQAYNGSLQQLQARIPELYALALERYRAEGETMADKLALTQQQEEKSYGRYQANLQGWRDEQQRLYSAYRDSLADQQAQREYDYRAQRDAVEDSRWQREFDEAVRQFNAKRR